jgi:hypothetical protein
MAQVIMKDKEFLNISNDVAYFLNNNLIIQK